MKKLLLIGQGQIGSALARDLTEFKVHVWLQDIDDLTSDALREIAPNAIINTAGKTDLAWCEANTREAVRSNLEAPVRLYQRILDTGDGIRFIHFSSGCVWDGPFTKSGQPFTANVPPTPSSFYSWTKAAADAMLMDMDPDRIAILRPRQVYSGNSHPRNTLVKLLKYPRLIDTPNSVSSMNVIEKTVRYMLSANEDWTGIWSVYDPGITSPFKIGEMLWDAGLRTEPLQISKEELDVFHKPKRVDTVLYDERFERAIGPEQSSVQLSRAIATLKNTFQIP